MDAEIAGVADKIAIRELTARYNHAIDEGRVDEWVATFTDDGTFVDELVLCRQRGDVPLTPPDRIDYMDVAPEQLVSIAAALIPFLEHDDANRALMGSNMQRQAVPLLNPRTPLVGTGLEEKVAKDSGAVVIARRAGVITRVTADEIIVDAGPAERVQQDRRSDDRPPRVSPATPISQGDGTT